jgi:Icc-related predicted phosphoesterase
MNILTVSDVESSLIYSPNIKNRFKEIDLAISSGDLSYFYLEYIISALDVPLYYVRGNHAKEIEYGHAGTRESPWGAVNLHRKVVRDRRSGLLLAGIQGCLRYNEGPYQYTQNEMWLLVMSLVPGLLRNKLRYGRYLDIFVTHAPPWGIHDAKDRAHQGVKAFLWLVKIFQPRYHLHGHVHIYNPYTISKTALGKTWIYNTYGFRKFPFDAKNSAKLTSNKQDD